MNELVSQLRTINVVTQSGKINKQANRMLNKYPDVKQQIISSTAFLYSEATIITRLLCIIHNVTEQPCCSTCKKPLIPLHYNYAKRRFVYMCQNTTGTSCAMSNANVRNERTNTLIEKYGVDNPSKNQKVIEKRKITNRRKYGGNAPASSMVIRNKIKSSVEKKTQEQMHATLEKRKQSMLENHGAATYAQSILTPEVYERVIKYSYDPCWLYDQHYVQKRTITEISEYIGVTPAVMSARFKKLNIEVVRYVNSNSRSQEEQEVAEFISSILGESVEVRTNDKNVVPPFEIDIYIPRYNIAIEYCGVYWHSELNGKHKLYHATKNEMCSEKGIQLISIWSSEWLKKPGLVKSRLQNILQKNADTIAARKCIVQHINSKVGNDFLNATHIQGGCKASVWYGLYYQEVHLVAVMSFSKDRFSKKDRFELVRFATMQGSNVVGAAGKLFKSFITEHPSTGVVSYSDNRWNTGRMYKQLGFSLSHTSSPNYFYFDRTGNTNVLYSRIHFQKHKLQKMLDFFDPVLTEWENMKLNGYDRIWDCGNDVWIWEPQSKDKSLKS